MLIWKDTAAIAPLPRVTAHEAVRRLERDGWYRARQVDSHAHYRHGSKPGTVTVPMHGNRILVPQVLKSILRQAGLTEDAFRNL